MVCDLENNSVLNGEKSLMEDLSSIKVEWVYRERAKRYIVRFVNDMHIKVTIPKGGTKQEAAKFLKMNQAVILERLARLKKNASTQLFTDDSYYKTFSHKVKILKNQKENKVKVQREQAFIYLKTEGTSQEEQQDIIKKAFEIILRNEGKQYLPKRTFELAKQFNFQFQQVKVNAAKGRWGSCSSERNINFSLFLMSLPLHLIDYTILHELCHTIHHNHSPAFWALLDTCVGGKNAIFKKEMEKYSTKIKVEYYEKINFADCK